MTTGKKAAIAIVVIGLIGIFIAAAVRNLNSEQDSAAAPKNAYPVELEQPHRETIISKVTAKGTVELNEKTTMYCGNSSEITKLHVNVGDVIEKGQLVLEYSDKGLETLKNQLDDARLALRNAELGLQGMRTPPTDTEIRQAELLISQHKKTLSDIDAQIVQIDISIDQIKRSLQSAEKKHNDTKILYDKGAVTKTELDAAYDAIIKLEDQLDTTNAQKQTTLLGIPLAQENLSYAEEQYEVLFNRSDDPKIQIQINQQQLAIDQARMKITQLEKQINEYRLQETAAADGVVINLSVSEGETTSNGRQMIVIADTDNNNLIISANVPENEASELKIGQEVEITGSALGKSMFSGRLSKIYPVAEIKQVGNSVETVLSIEISEIKGSGILRPGYSIEADIITDILENVLVAPLMSTLTETDGSSFVYIMREDYTVEKRTLVLGKYTGIYIQAEGINEDDNIILNPTPQIKDGIHVRPISRQSR